MKQKPNTGNLKLSNGMDASDAFGAGTGIGADSNVKGGSLPPRTSTHAKTGLNTKELALCGLMGGLCAVIMLFRFPLPFMPPFMDFDFAGLVEIIGGFVMGPVAAVAIILVKVLIKALTQGTSSAWTGEFQNFLLSCAYVLPAVLIYDRHKSKKTAIGGMIAGTVVCAVVAVFTNLYLIIPFYASFAGWTLDDILAMCRAVNPLLSSKWSLAFLGIVPFNLIKNGVLSLLTFIVYKKISRQIKHFLQ